MEHVKDLLKTTLDELEKILSSRSVVGQPINVNGLTLIPLSSIGFGFGAGGGTGSAVKAKAAEGEGAGTGAGGGIKPLAVIVVDKDGAHVQSIKGATASVLESVGGALVKAVERKSAKTPES